MFYKSAMLRYTALSLSFLLLSVRCAPAPQLNPHPTTDTEAGPTQTLNGTLSSNATSPISNTTIDRPSATSASSNPVLLFPTGTPMPSSPSIFQASLTMNQVRPLVMAYYPDWAGASFPPEKIDCTRFDWIDFAFALPTESFELAWDSEEAPMLLKRLVAMAHSGSCRTMVKLSIGGWTGSKHFSSAVATEDSRHRFVSNIAVIYNEYNLDGIDIDWEYPAHPGANGNEVNPKDSGNFLLFLQYLRVALPSTARISAAVQATPFTDSSGQPMHDVSSFAKILDWVLIMNYDVWSSSPIPGPDAPMHDGCKNSAQPEANAVAAYNAWTSAGFPASQLVLGLPSYGYISNTNATSLRTRSTFRSRHLDHRTFDDISTESIKNIKVKGEDDSNTVQFRDLIQQGALVLIKPADMNNPSVYEGAGGYQRRWDNCSSTPYLRSDTANQVISYDDPKSLSLKARFAKEVGMLGTNMFDVHGDSDQWDLTDAVRQALGLK